MSSKPGTPGKQEPKKKPKKGPLTVEQKIEISGNRIKVLEEQLEKEMQHTRDVAEERKKYKLLYKQATDKIEDTTEDQFAVATEFGRRNKVLTKELSQMVNTLEFELAELKDELEIVNLIIEQTKLDHVKQSNIRDQIIEDQHKKIDNMNRDFTDMMKETLDKVTGRIEKTQKATPTPSDFIPTSVLTKLKELQS